MAVRPTNPSQNKDARIQFLVTKKEREGIEAQARKEGLNKSEFVREVVMLYMEGK